MTRTVADVENERRQYRNQKSALTRAVNTQDPEKVIAATKKAVSEWEGWHYGWPDDWHRWNIALSDAFNLARHRYVTGETSVKPDANRFDMDTIRQEAVLNG